MPVVFPFVGKEATATAATALLSLSGRRPASPSSEADALRRLKDELANAPHEDKTALAHVQRVRPELADDDHLLRFLRADEYDVKLALKRLLRYWEFRHKWFGDDYALPMSLNGAMRGCVHAVKQGYFNLLPVLDRDGRAILYLDSLGFRKGESETPPAEERVKVVWYLLHVMMEHPSVLKRGFVFVANTEHLQTVDFLPRAIVAARKSFEVMPIRWERTEGEKVQPPSPASHVFHASQTTFLRIAAAMKAIWPGFLRNKFMLHDGSVEDVLKELCNVEDLGGNLKVDAEAFVQQRLAIEEDPSDSKQDGEKGSSCTSAVEPQDDAKGQSLEEKAATKRSLEGSDDIGNERKRPCNSRGCPGESSPVDDQGDGMKSLPPPPPPPTPPPPPPPTPPPEPQPSQEEIDTQHLYMGFFSKTPADVYWDHWRRTAPKPKPTTGAPLKDVNGEEVGMGSCLAVHSLNSMREEGEEFRAMVDCWMDVFEKKK